MDSNLSLLIQYKDLLWSWTKRTISARYQQSILGGLWIIAQPLSTVFVFSIIFTYFVPIDTGDIPYPVFSYIAIIPWTFFATSISDMTTSLVANISLVTKIYFPREVLPISAMLARGLDFTVGFGIFFIVMLIFRAFNPTTSWLLLPLIVFIQILLILGFGLLASAMNVFFRDVQSILTLIIQLWFYASPIIYPVSMVPKNLLPYYYINPMAGVLESYRAILLYGTIPGNYVLISAGISVGLFILGYSVFKRAEPKFADIV